MHTELRNRGESGFSLVEMMIALTITLIVTSLAFTLLASVLRQKTRDTGEASALADANQALTWLSMDLLNSGFGLRGNGLVSADCGENVIRIRANLNAFLKETTSNSVTDPNEDVIYRLVPNPDGAGSSLVRSDVGANESTVVSTRIDDTDVDNDGDGDGLTFEYRLTDGTITTPELAMRVTISLRTVLPAVGTPGSTGYQPQRIRVVSNTFSLRNIRMVAY